MHITVDFCWHILLFLHQFHGVCNEYMQDKWMQLSEIFHKGAEWCDFHAALSSDIVILLPINYFGFWINEPCVD